MIEQLYVLQYYLMSVLMALATWPLVRRLLPATADGGWCLARPLTLLLVSWIVWIAGSLNISAISFTGVWVAFVLLVAILYLLLPRIKDWAPRTSLKPDQKSWIIAHEIILFCVLAYWTYVRGFAPDIQGLEKYMDFGFINTILRSDSFPPQDHFLAGEPINYYYFGQFQAAIMIRLSGVLPSFGYNIQMSAIFAQLTSIVFVFSASLFSCLRSKKQTIIPFRWSEIATGAFGAILVGWIGNGYAFYYTYIEPNPKFFYATATRFIHNSIHEYPLYSFVVNDLHAHVANLPSVLLIMIMLWNILRTPMRNPRARALFVLVSFAIGSCYISNAWDYMIYLIFAGCIYWIHLAEHPKYLFKPKILIFIALISAALVGLSCLFFLPFWLHFEPMSQGVRAVTNDQRTPLWQLGIVWGTHLIPGLVALFTLKKARETSTSVDHFYYYILFGLSLFFIALPEFIYFKDIYTDHPRANTMFKFYYQAWLMIGIAAAVGTALAFTHLKKYATLKRFALSIGVAACLFIGFTFTSRSLDQAFGSFLVPRKDVGGMNYIAKTYPSDFEAIQWFNKNVPGQPTILEGVSDSYTDGARIATFTGLPTVLGWPTHEWLWRGGLSVAISPPSHLAAEIMNERRKTNPNALVYIDSVAQRRKDVETIYTTPSDEIARTLLNQYGVSYVVIGPLERRLYPALQKDKFQSIALSTAFSSGETTVYRIK